MVGEGVNCVIPCKKHATSKCDSKKCYTKWGIPGNCGPKLNRVTVMVVILVTAFSLYSYMDRPKKPNQ